MIEPVMPCPASNARGGCGGGVTVLLGVEREGVAGAVQPGSNNAVNVTNTMSKWRESIDRTRYDRVVRMSKEKTCMGMQVW